MSNRRLINVRELAEMLNVPASWIYDRTRQGQKAIPFLRLGAYVRFDAEEVINFFKTHGTKSIISHRHMEMTANHECSYHISSHAEIRPIDALSSRITGGQADKGETSSHQQKNLHLAHKRAFPQELSSNKKETRPPKEDLNNTSELGTILA